MERERDFGRNIFGHFAIESGPYILLQVQDNQRVVAMPLNHSRIAGQNNINSVKRRRVFGRYGSEG